MSEEELSNNFPILLNEAHTIKPFDCEDIDLNEFYLKKQNSINKFLLLHLS